MVSDRGDRATAGVVAFYSVIHIPRAEVAGALAGFRRALRPGGWALLAFHVGDHVIHLDEWWGERVALDFVFFEREEMEAYARDAGLDLAEVIEREPYPEVEVQTRRAYLFARRPTGTL